MTFAVIFSVVMLLGFLAMILVEGNPSTKTLKQWLGLVAIAHFAAVVAITFPAEEPPESSTVLLIAIGLIYTYGAFGVKEKEKSPQRQDY